MRITIDLPEDLHRIALSLAQHTDRSLSQTIAALVRAGLQLPAFKPQGGKTAFISPVTCRFLDRREPLLRKTSGRSMKNELYVIAEQQRAGGALGYDFHTSCRRGRLANFDHGLAAIHSDVAELIAA